MFDQVMGTRSIARRPYKKYRAPSDYSSIELTQVLADVGRQPLEPKQLNLLRSADDRAPSSVQLYCAGDLTILDRPCVAIVGSRQASADGIARARRLARELANAGLVVVSGLAQGIDTAAHTSAIENGGATVAVIGTPLDKAYPAENSVLQEQIYTDHLLVSPFQLGERTFRSSFPKRNRVMAALSDATVIIEASDTSGTLHQAAECAQLGRWLFIAKSLADSSELSWPQKFLKNPKTAVLTSTDDLVRTIEAERP